VNQGDCVDPKNVLTAGIAKMFPPKSGRIGPRETVPIPGMVKTNVLAAPKAPPDKRVYPTVESKDFPSRFRILARGNALEQEMVLHPGTARPFAFLQKTWELIGEHGGECRNA
jgi:hypothetical protein